VRWPARPAELRAGLDFFWYFFASKQKSTSSNFGKAKNPDDDRIY